jgi:hypothetical protein
MTTTTIALGRLVSSRIEKVYQQYVKNPDVDVDVKEKDIEVYDYTYYDSDNDNDNSNSSEIYSTTTIWFSGRDRRLTIYLSHDLLKKYNMARPCRISLSDTGSGILLKFLHSTTYNNK